MYLEEIANKLPGQRVKIKYDCNGGYQNCGQESTPIYKVAKKNFEANGGKHICRSCQLAAKNPMKRKDVQEKIKQTCLERYGTATAMNTTKNIDKRRQLFQNEQYVEQIIKKRKRTNLDKYGVEFAQQSESVKEKQKQTMLARYGVEHPYQSLEVMTRMRANNLKKYGVENVAQLPEVQIKMAQTTLERFGVEHYNQLPEMKDYLRENCKEWLAESYANPWAKGIIRPEEWNQKQRETVIQLVLDGKWKSGPKNCLRGYYEGVKCRRMKPMFRSSYELRVHRFLDTNEDVEFYDYEPFSIPYFDKDGKSKWYIPDFIVKYCNRTDLEIIEVKPNYLIGSEDVEFKSAGANILVSQHSHLKYNIWGTKFIEEFGYSVDDLLELPEVTLL